MVFKILEQVVKKSNLDPQMVEDICLGNVSHSTNTPGISQSAKRC